MALGQGKDAELHLDRSSCLTAGGAGVDDLAFLWLCLGGVGNDDAAHLLSIFCPARLSPFSNTPWNAEWAPFAG